jgi:hypothetical protein
MSFFIENKSYDTFLYDEIALLCILSGISPLDITMPELAWTLLANFTIFIPVSPINARLGIK